MGSAVTLSVPLMPGSDYTICLFFQDGHHVRLGKHGAINSCSVFVGRLSVLQVWPRPFIVHVFVLHQKKVEKMSIMAIEVTSRNMSYDLSNSERKFKKFRHARLSIRELWGIPDTTSLSSVMLHYKALSLAEFVQYDPSIIIYTLIMIWIILCLKLEIMFWITCFVKTG